MLYVAALNLRRPMTYPRYSFGNGILKFSLELPPGLFADEIAGASAGAGEPLVVFRSIADGPALVVAVAVAGGAASLIDALQAAGAAFLTSDAFEASCGGPARSHHGLLWREQGAGWIRSRFALECGGVVLVAAAEAPAGLWNDYGTFAERAMMTIEVSYPATAPELPLLPSGVPPADGDPVADPRIEEDARRDRAIRDAEAAAGALIAQGRHEEAVALVSATDADIRGANVLARQFERALSSASDAGQADVLYALARDWAWRSLPSPQTAVEGEQHSAALADIEARLADLRGRIQQ